MASRTLTGNSRRREQRIQSLMIDRVIVRFERRLAREIARTMRAGGRPGADLNAIESDHWDRLNILLTTMHRQSAGAMARYLAQAFAPAKMESVAATVIMDAVMVDFSKKFGSELITNLISRTTISDIRRVIEQGTTDGLSELAIADLVSAVAPTKSASRAQTIARTEIHAASQWASQQAVEATGVEFDREWVSSMGERTRPTHSDANGQIRGINEPFIVGDAELMYPGEYNPEFPQETINCRCVVSYIPI